MAFACQRDSYLKRIETRVLSCKETDFSYSVYGKKEKKHGYAVTLEDTVLFPEGGGQPYDTGVIGGGDVVAVMRDGAQAVHYMDKPLAVGVAVAVEVNWQRRFDHMQQHSSQHLLTAVSQQLFGFETMSWCLGEKVSTIELNTPAVTKDEIEEIEQKANSLIRNSVAVEVKMYDKDAAELKEAYSRGLPDDAAGPVRVVSIGTLDQNLCCGTHVSNLAHLQTIKILFCEKGKKGKTNMTFIAGNRVLSYLASSVEYQKEMTKILKGRAEEHVHLTKRIQMAGNDAAKANRSLLKTLAEKEVELFRHTYEANSICPLFTLHCTLGDLDFMTLVSNGILSINSHALIFLTVGDLNGKGLFLLSGIPDDSYKIIEDVCSLLGGKGALKNGKCHGKASNLKNITAVVSYLSKAFIADKNGSKI